MEKNVIKEYILNWEEFINSTKEEYRDKNADLLAEKIYACKDDIKNAIFVWLKTREVTDIAECGLNVQTLIEKAGMQGLGAFLTLDWVAKTGQPAIDALKKEYLF